jgi:ABC-type transporter Mla MlaB component
MSFGAAGGLTGERRPNRLVAPERGVPAPATNPSPATLTIRGRIAAADARPLCDDASKLLAERAGDILVCDVKGLVATDAGTVDALCRLALIARRLGSPIVLQGASPELCALIDLMGLANIVPCEGGDSVLEPRRQSEQREVPRGVEEEVDPGDLTA